MITDSLSRISEIRMTNFSIFYPTVYLIRKNMKTNLMRYYELQKSGISFSPQILYILNGIEPVPNYVFKQV